MTSRGQIWKCEVCGNIIEILHEGADALVCCGQPMNLQEGKTEALGGHDSSEPEEDILIEKHKPVIEGKLVKVGSVPHPMEDAHYIEWIEATSAAGEVAKIFLKPGMAPEAEFDFEPVSTRAYCNVHGLWKG